MSAENVLPYIIGGTKKRPLPEAGYPAAGNMRRKESWMVKGTRVAMTTGMGTIMNVIGCIKGGYGAGYLGEEMVLKVYVQPDNVEKAWPMNPYDVEPVQMIKKAI